MVFPNILIEEHNKYIEESIQLLHNGENNQKDLSYQENDSNKTTKLILVKSRMGYVYPLFASFIVSDDNDYSDSYLIKVKMENKEPKSEYAYYILANDEFTIENISSSALNLELSLDLLKKYVVKMDVLVRTENDKPLNIIEKYTEFEEEPKVITWVFPDIIYPKDDSHHNNDEEIEDLIEKSNKKTYNLIIKAIKFNGEENIAYLFKLTENKLKKKKKKFKY